MYTCRHECEVALSFGLKFGASISELPSKYGKAPSIDSEFADARVCAASAIYTSTIIAYVNN